ncbi:hypothetical protein [Paenibacillus sp. p3-SID867]
MNDCRYGYSQESLTVIQIHGFTGSHAGKRT